MRLTTVYNGQYIPLKIVRDLRTDNWVIRDHLIVRVQPANATSSPRESAITTVIVWYGDKTTRL